MLRQLVISFMNTKISFITLGCKLNYAETSTYERRLLESVVPLEVTPWSKGADIFLVNTCSVTEHSDGVSTPRPFPEKSEQSAS